MSIVRDFADAMHTQAAAMIGEEDVVIDSATLKCVMAMADHSKDFTDSGRKHIKALRATCKTSALPAFELLKKQATARGETWRVESVSRGATFTTIALEQETKA